MSKGGSSLRLGFHDLGAEVQGSGRFMGSSSGSRVQGSGFRVYGLGLWFLGSGFGG